MKMSVRPAAETREQTHGTEVGRRSVKHRRTSCRASIHHLEQARLNRGDSHPSLQSTALIRYLGEPITVIGVGRRGMTLVAADWRNAVGKSIRCA